MSRRLVVLTLLYVAQGLPFGFFTQALPVRMREGGMSLGAIGFASLLAAPWALKGVIAPLVDAHGSRRAWIVPLQLGAVAVLIVASFLPPERALVPVLIAVFLSNALAAAQDVATDALAVDVLAPKERGLGNGLQVAGYRVGMMLGGGALLIVLGTIGWGAALRLLALGTAITTLPLLMTKPPARKPAPRVRWAEIAAGLSRPHALLWLALLAVYKLGDAIATAMLRPMMVDRGLGAADVGLLLGQVGFGAGLFGALLGGGLVRELGRGRSLVSFGVLQAIGIAAYALPVPLPLAIGFEHLAGGMATAALFTCMMDACRPELAATDYAVQASLVVIATGFGAALSGVLAEAAGYAGCFAIAAAVALAGVALAESLRRHGALVLPAGGPLRVSAEDGL